MIQMPKAPSLPVLEGVITSENAEAAAPPMFIKGFLGGVTGSGKTQSSVTLPKSVDHPLLLIDLDNRWETVRDLVEAKLVEVITIVDEDPSSSKPWDRIEKLRHELWAKVRKGEFKYSGVIEDGLSQLSTYAKNSAVTLRGRDGKDTTGLGGTPSQGHWGAQIAFVERHVNSIRNLPCHYILTGHFDIEKNEDDGKIRVMPKITKSLRSVIPSWFNEVYYCWRKDAGGMQYFWTTAGSETYEFFKSTLNNKQRYWKDPIPIVFPDRDDWWNGNPIGFDRLLRYRLRELKQPE